MKVVAPGRQKPEIGSPDDMHVKRSHCFLCANGLQRLPLSGLAAAMDYGSSVSCKTACTWGNSHNSLPIPNSCWKQSSLDWCCRFGQRDQVQQDSAGTALSRPAHTLSEYGPSGTSAAPLASTVTDRMILDPILFPGLHTHSLDAALRQVVLRDLSDV